MEIDIKKLALLARIKLEEGEEEKLKKDFEGILGYVEKLKDAKFGELEADQPAMLGVALRAELPSGGDEVGELKNVMREDEATNEAGEYTEDLLKSAPETEKGCVKVGSVFGK